MKNLKFFIIVCVLFLGGAFYSDVQATISIIEKQSVQVKYKYVRSIEAYLVNNSGNYSKSNLEYDLVQDASGKYYVACKTRYGVSYHAVQYANNRMFKYTFYAAGWLYFN